MRHIFTHKYVEPTRVVHFKMLKKVKMLVAYNCILNCYIYLVLQYNHATTINKINYGMR